MESNNPSLNQHDILMTSDFVTPMDGARGRTNEWQRIGGLFDITNLISLGTLIVILMSTGLVYVCVCSFIGVGVTSGTLPLH